MGFNIPSDQEEIKELNEKIENLTDDQIFTNGGGEEPLSEGTFGRRNSADGRADGLRGTTPRIHQLTEKDESGTPTGTFDRINLITTLVIVDHTSTPMSLKFINGKPVPGTSLRVTPRGGKALTIETGGDFDITSSISVIDDEYVDFIFFSEAETGITGGGFKRQKVGTAGGAGYDTIQEEGVSLTQRSIMNFIGATVTAVDNPGASRTDITIVAGTAGLLSDLTINVAKNWQAFGITNLGQLSMVGDIDLATQDIINIDRSEYVVDSGAVSAATDSVILLNSSNQFQFNTAQINDIVFSLENIAAVAIDHDGTALTRSLSVLSDSTNTNSIAVLNITKNFATSISLQEIGQIGFNAANDAGGGIFEYAAIVGKIEDATAGSIDGSLRLEATINNSVIPFLSINDGSSGEVTLFRDLNINTQNILNIDQSRYVVDSGAVSSNTDTVILLNSNAQFQFNTDKINDFIFSFDNNAALALNQDPLDDDNRFLTIQSDSTNINSASFLNITKAFPIPLATQTIGGISFKAGTSLGSGLIEYAGITAIAQDITSPSFDGILRLETILNGSITPFIDLNNASDGKIHLFRTLDVNTNFIELTEIAKPSNPVANDGLIYVKDVAGTSTPFFLDSAGIETSMIASAGIPNQIIEGNTSITITDPGSGVINLVVDGIAVGNITDTLGWIIDNSDLTISSATGKLAFQNGFEIQNENSTVTTFAIPDGKVLLIKEGVDTRIQVDKNIILNADANDDIIFREGGSNVGRFDGGLDDWVFERDILLDGGTRIRSFDSTKIGIFLTNSTDSIGSAGTNQSATEPSISTSVANLDAAFGDGIGSWGVFNTSSAFVNIAYKILSNEWVVLALPDGGGTVISDHIT